MELMEKKKGDQETSCEKAGPNDGGAEVGMESHTEGRGKRSIFTMMNSSTTCMQQTLIAALQMMENTQIKLKQLK